MQGKRIVMTGPREVQLQPYDLPDEDLGRTEVLVRTRVSLLSGGTEGAMFQGYWLPGRPPLPWPRACGYANVGEVLGVGPGVAGLAPGDLVYSMSNHASLVRVDAAQRLCVKVPEGLPLEEAVFARLTTVPLATVRTAAARAGDRAAVVGLGVVGNLGAQVLQAAGMEVTGIDLLPGRRELARRCGIVNALDPLAADAVQPAHRLVLEATGTAKGAVTAIALAQLGGEVSLVGTPWVPDASVASKEIIEPIHCRYITVRSGWEWQLPILDTRDQPSAVHQPGSQLQNTLYAFDLLRQGKVRVRELITHRFSPEDCQRAYDGAVDRKAEQLGTIFRWE